MTHISTISQNKELAGSILASIDIPIATIDVKGDVLSINEAWNEYFNNFHDKPVCNVFTDFIVDATHNSLATPQYPNELVTGIQDVLAGAQKTFSGKFQIQNGSENKWYHIKVTPLVSDMFVTIIQVKEATDKKQGTEKLTDQINALIRLNRVLESAQSISKQGSFSWNIENNKIQWSDEYYRILGMERQSERSALENFMSRVVSEDVPHLENSLAELRRTGVSESVKFRIKLEDRSTKIIRGKARATRNSEGKIIYINGVIQDITDQEKIKRKLEESENKSRLLFDYSPVQIWEEDFSEIASYINNLKEQGVTDFRKYFYQRQDEVEKLASSARFKRVNQTTLDFYKVKSLDELIQNLKDWFVDDSWHTFTEEIIALAEGKSEFTGEVPIVSHTGTHYDMYMRLTVPPQYSETLEVVLISFVDITQVKENEKILKTQEERLREYSLELEQKIASRTKKLAESESKLLQAQMIAKLGIWEWDAIQNEYWWSDQLYENFGLSPDISASSTLYLDLVHPEDRAKVSDQISSESTINHPKSQKHRIVTSTGEIRYMHTARQQVFSESGQLQKIIGVVQDITQLEKAEMLRSQVDSVLQGQEMERERIAADLHDSINPLISIANLNIQALQEYGVEGCTIPPEKLNGVVELLENVLNGISEISQNLSPTLLKRFGLDQAIKQLCKRINDADQVKIRYYSYLKGKKLPFDIELSLYRITQELVNNVIKHAQATHTEIQLVLHEESVLLMISDDGAGFNWSNKILKKDSLGLKNLNSRVEGLHGTLSIDSSIGQGTVVSVEIPFAEKNL